MQQGEQASPPPTQTTPPPFSFVEQTLLSSPKQNPSRLTLVTPESSMSCTSDSRPPSKSSSTFQMFHPTVDLRR